MALYYIVLHKEAMPGRGSLQTNVADQHVLSDHRQHHPQSQGLTDVDAMGLQSLVQKQVMLLTKLYTAFRLQLHITAEN